MLQEPVRQHSERAVTDQPMTTANHPHTTTHRSLPTRVFPTSTARSRTTDATGAEGRLWDRRSCVRSTNTPTQRSPPSGSQRSAATSPTRTCRSRSDASGAPSPAGPLRSSPGTLARHERADRSGEQLGEADQAGRVRTRELPTPPSPLPALCRPTRLDPPTLDPTLKRGEPHVARPCTALFDAYGQTNENV